MNEPKVELKSLKFHQGHEGMGMNADVWINGVKCMHVMDDGNGGCLDFQYLSYGSKNPEQIKSLIKNLNDYIDSLPEKPLNFGKGDIKDEQGNVRMDKTTLEDYINELTYEIERKKDLKKKEKFMLTSILFGIPNGNSYQRISYICPLSKIPTAQLQTKLNRIVLTYCKKGVKILNTNLESLGLKINY